jgi:hypothetical protein
MKIFMFVPWNPLDGYILEPPNDSVQLVPITPMSLWYNYGLWYVNNELVIGANLNQQT